MITTTTVYIEVKLTEGQIYERRLKLENELDEQDKLTGAVSEKKREIKDTNLSIERVTDRVRQLRREIRLGFVVEAREAQLRLPDTFETADTIRERPTQPGVGGIDAGDDGYSPDPDTDPKPPPRDVFAELYPMARSHGALRDYLFEVLTDEQYTKLPDGTVEGWDVHNGIFDAIAHWARVGIARKDASERAKRGDATVDGLYVPTLPPMPPALAALLGPSAKKRRGARPLSSPSSGTPAAAPKAKKRRSGSTQHSG